MLIGIPKEIMREEYRVALTPAGAEALTQAGHQVLLEAGAGQGSGFTDDFYTAAGAELVPTSDEVWARAEMIMKVKEPIEPEWGNIRPDQVLFTYFHFASSEELTRALIASRAVAIAYETVELPSGELPLLTPMSEVAGRMAVQEGAKYLERHSGGAGVLLGGVPGVLPGKVVILGGGVVGTRLAPLDAASGVVTLAGYTDSASFPTTPNVFQPNLAGNFDQFVTRLQPAAAGSAQLVFSTFLGGSGDESILRFGKMAITSVVEGSKLSLSLLWTRVYPANSPVTSRKPVSCT